MEKIILYLILGLVQIGSQFISADTTAFYNTEEGYVFPYPEECANILDTFAQYAGNFTACSIQHARPIQLCEKCINQYVQFYQKFEELLTTKVNGTTCRSVFISRDRLDAVLEYHNNIMGLWEKGNCNACFNWSGNEPVLSNSTKKFNKMYNATMECILLNYNLNSSDVCEKCMQSYIELDKFYQTLSTDSVGVVDICMDIVDSMNATRSVWSKTFNCCKLRKTPELVFLVCTVVISFLPLLFYLAVRYLGPIKDLPNVLRQSRFKQKFMRKSED